MGRKLAELAEIVDRANESLAEMPAPDTIHQHPGGERVLRTGQPAGELESTALRWGERRLIVAG